MAPNLQRPDIPLPPDSITRGLGGSGQFHQIGEEYARYFIDLGGLEPEQTMLDLGCGCGRMAFPLTGYLTSGRYIGIDVDAAAIRWAQENITTRHPQFSFTRVDVHHVSYNPGGAMRSDALTLPVDTGSIDLVVLVSLFTHLRPGEANRYLAEISRVLRPGGRALVTGFLLNSEVLLLHQLGKWKRKEEHRMPRIGVGGALLSDDETVYAVYWDEACLLGLFRHHGLIPQLPVAYGSWCGREHFVSQSQDIVIAVK